MLLKDFVAGGSDLHAATKSKKTPLLAAVESLLGGRVELSSSYLTKLMMPWLCSLEQAGVNLSSYGRKEKALIESGRLKVDFIFEYDLHIKEYWGNSSIVPMSLHLIGFEYGPKPDNWKFWISDPTDEFVGDFWHLIGDTWEVMGEVPLNETPWETMAGAWID